MVHRAAILRILCLTDGDDTGSIATANQAGSHLRRYIYKPISEHSIIEEQWNDIFLPFSYSIIY